jgi:arginyl-tRNA synthetase
MALRKVLDNKPPRDIAAEIVKRLPLGDLLEKPEIAGPGFINVRLQNGWLAARLQEMARSDRLGVAEVAQLHTVVIDYGSPNVAKPMHVGHLRSTIIGDAIARLLRFFGHTVIADNHLGDWGGQFGMLLYGYKHFRDEEALKADPVQEMVRLYVKVRQLTKSAEKDDDEEGTTKYTPQQVAEAQQVMTAVREETAKLHAGDAENLALWHKFMPWCLEEIKPVFDRLDIHYQHQLGESHYHPMLPGVVDELRARGIAEPSQGAIVVLFGENEAPAFVRYSSGAYGYMTSDLATVRLRVEELKADEILYVVGAPQAPHLKQLFEIARRWGYDKVKFEHIAFGSVLEKDPETGKLRMFRTRGGRVVELNALLDEAVVQAAQRYVATRDERIDRGEEVPELGPRERQEIAEQVGLGAVKYADLCQSRTSDYIFDWDKMLAMEGNTATYMQYAYVRNRGIFRKGNEDEKLYRTNPPLPVFAKPEERALAVRLLQFEEHLQAAAADYRPSVITGYLWELSRTYSSFNHACPVLKAETPELRKSRLLLCDLTARVIQQGLGLLGIRTVERM